jgi:phosphocarrier protein HPr
MEVREITIKNQSGLQSKSAAVFIQKASNFKSDIWIEKEERKANGKSLLGLLSLAIGFGSRVIIIADGEDEDKAANELENFLMTDTAGLL